LRDDPVRIPLDTAIGQLSNGAAMSDQPVILAVASYRSRSAASDDVHALSVEERAATDSPVAAALVQKGADGELAVDAHVSTSSGPVWSGAILAAALTVLAPPVGIGFLAKVVGSMAALAGIHALASHFWNNVPQDDLRRMSELLESGQAAILVVASGPDDQEVDRLLSMATTTITASTAADLEDCYARGVGGYAPG